MKFKKHSNKIKILISHPARDLRDFTTGSPLLDTGVDAVETLTTSLLLVVDVDDRFSGVLVVVLVVETGGGGEKNPSDGVGKSLVLSVFTNFVSNSGF